MSLVKERVVRLQVEYLDYNHRLVKEATAKESLRIGNLRPHRNYTFTVTVRAGSGSNGSAGGPVSPVAAEMRVSLPMSASFSTRESVPEKVPPLSHDPVDWPSVNLVLDGTLSLRQSFLMTLDITSISIRSYPSILVH